MRARRGGILAAGFVLLSALLAPGARAACDVDQSQELYNGGTSARTLPGYTIWQSFTPSLSGTLCQIDMGFFNDMSGQGELRIREGAGTSGAILQSLTVPVVAYTRPGVSWNSWTVSVSVIVGSLYTFEFVPDAATLPDPYGVAIGASNPYAAGAMGIDDPSGTYPTDFDMNFRTYVTKDAEIEVFRSNLPEYVATPPNLIGTATGSSYDDMAPPAVPLLFYQVDDGLGVPGVIYVEEIAGGVRLLWP